MRTKLSILATIVLCAMVALHACDGGNNRPPAFSTPGSTSAGSGTTSTGTAQTGSSGKQSSSAPVLKNYPFKSERSLPFWSIHLDTSGSMEGEKIVAAKAAIIEFLDQADPELVFALYCFDGMGGTVEMVPFCENSRELIKKVLPGIGTGGRTPLGGGIRFTTEKLREQEERQLGHGQFNGLFVTDGAADDAGDMEQAVKEMNRPGTYGSPMNLYTIGFQLGGTHALAANSVKYLEADDKAGLVAALMEATKSETETIDDLLK